MRNTWFFFCLFKNRPLTLCNSTEIEVKDDNFRPLMIQRHGLCCDCLALSALVLGWVLQTVGQTVRKCSLQVSASPLAIPSSLASTHAQARGPCWVLCRHTRNTWLIILYYKWHFHVSTSLETIPFSERFLGRMGAMFFFPPVISELGMVSVTL